MAWDDGARTIYVCIAVDVAGVVAGSAGEDVTAGTTRPTDNSAGLIVATSPPQDKRQAVETAGLSSLTRSAQVGDCLRIYAVSGSNNFEDAVLLADVGTGGETSVLDRFALVALDQIPIAPSDAPMTLSADSDEQEFWFWQSRIAGEGTQECHAVLAVYGRDDHGRPRFAGLYRWDFPLTVTLTEPSASANEGVAS